MSACTDRILKEILEAVSRGEPTQTASCAPSGTATSLGSNTVPSTIGVLVVNAITQLSTGGPSYDPALLADVIAAKVNSGEYFVVKAGGVPIASGVMNAKTVFSSSGTGHFQLFFEPTDVSGFGISAPYPPVTTSITGQDLTFDWYTVSVLPSSVPVVKICDKDTITTAGVGRYNVPSGGTFTTPNFMRSYTISIGGDSGGSASIDGLTRPVGWSFGAESLSYGNDLVLYPSVVTTNVTAGTTVYVDWAV